MGQGFAARWVRPRVTHVVEKSAWRGGDGFRVPTKGQLADVGGDGLIVCFSPVWRMCRKDIWDAGILGVCS